MTNNILIFEDDTSLLSVITDFILETSKFEVYHTTNDWCCIESWLNDVPGADTFAILIFDIVVPSYNLRDYDIPYNKSIHTSPSLYFIENYIKRKYPALLNRIILFSAYTQLIPSNMINQYTIIDKGDTNAIFELMNRIRLL